MLHGPDRGRDDRGGHGLDRAAMRAMNAGLGSRSAPGPLRRDGCEANWPADPLGGQELIDQLTPTEVRLLQFEGDGPRDRCDGLAPQTGAPSTPAEELTFCCHRT